MVETPVGRQQVENAAAGTAPGVCRAEHHAGDPGVHQRAGAHEAGLECGVQGGPHQALEARTA